MATDHTVKNKRLEELLPARPVAYRVGELRLELRSENAWAVVDGDQCLNTNNEWEPVPAPVWTTREFCERCRFPLQEAIRRAREVQAHKVNAHGE